MIYISAFSDEIAAELSEQISILVEETIRFVEFRSAWDKNVTALSDEEVQRVKQALAKAGLAVSAVGSPIGKFAINENLAEHDELFFRTVALAEQLDTQYIRIFSFYPTDPNAPEKDRTPILRQLETYARYAADHGRILLCENERGVYGDTPERCIDLVESIGSASFALTFDPANFLLRGFDNVADVYTKLSPYVRYFHIKDRKQDGGQAVVAGRGDAQVGRVLKLAAERNFDGFASLEPHLTRGGRFGGFTGPERFREAAAGLRELLRANEIDFT